MPPFLARVMVVVMDDRSICELATGDMFMPTYVLTQPSLRLQKGQRSLNHISSRPRFRTRSQVFSLTTRPTPTVIIVCHSNVAFVIQLFTCLLDV